MEEIKKSYTPLTAGQMYIGICTTRAQSANLRWQKAVVFMAINAVLANVCVSFWDHFINLKTGIPCVGLSAAALLINHHWGNLVDRANQWIDYYTSVLEKLEVESLREIGVLVFADPKYLSRELTEPKVKGIRFREGIKYLTTIMFRFWLAVFFFFSCYGMYLLGQGRLW
jgi:hypothetical protein